MLILRVKKGFVSISVPETDTRPFPDEPKETLRSTGGDGYYGDDYGAVLRGHPPDADLRTPCRQGEARHRCRFCPYSHSQRVHLARHEIKHTGEKPFWCDMCGKAFTRSSYLTVHQRLHTGERPYTCDTCGKSFVGSSSMLAHKKLQACRLYKCRHCSRAFAREETLIVHSLCHNQENS